MGAPLTRLDGLPADEASLDALVRRAPVPPLLVALAQATGDLSLLRDDLRPDPTQARDPHGGMSAEQRDAGCRLIGEALRRLAGDAPEPIPASETDPLRRMLVFLCGEEVSDDYLVLLREELGEPGEDRRAPQWRKDDIDPGRDFLVAIVGAGMSGLLAAHRLGQAGIDYVILEKSHDVGGTWLDNHYPGCRVDVPNHLYSYSFAQRQDWPQSFSPRSTLLDYFRRCADELGLIKNIRFGTEVVAARYDEEPGRWTLSLRTAEGGEEDLEADALVSAVGQLNRPHVPDFAGRDSFAGPSFHSARWDDGVALVGRRVAVVGTGASAIQLIPEVAREAGELQVYQRTPNWFLPTPEYHDDLPEETRWLLANVPFYSQWYRLWLFWRLAEGALPAAQVDPEWPEDGRSVSALNDGLRQLLTAYLESQFADAPDLLERVVPSYPPLAKRILLDNGAWAGALKADNVELVTEAISGIDETGITTADGVRREVDVIIYATGFQASRFLAPMRITGRGGADLHECWGDDARAYLGITVPGFPNLFCLYGPNTNLVANGSIIFFSECEVGYILGCIRLLLEGRHRALDCRRPVHDAYNRAIDEGNTKVAWGASSVHSWYKNSRGRITQNWPFSLLEFWRRTRRPDPADYELL